MSKAGQRVAPPTAPDWEPSVAWLIGGIIHSLTRGYVSPQPDVCRDVEPPSGRYVAARREVVYRGHTFRITVEHM